MKGNNELTIGLWTTPRSRVADVETEGHLVGHGSVRPLRRRREEDGEP